MHWWLLTLRYLPKLQHVKVRLNLRDEPEGEERSNCLLEELFSRGFEDIFTADTDGYELDRLAGIIGRRYKDFSKISLTIIFECAWRVLGRKTFEVASILQ